MRIIGSVKVAYAVRLKSFQMINQLEGTLTKKKDAYGKLEQFSKVRVDKLSTSKTDIENVINVS